MKRILALHGVGSSAEMLESQLAPLVAELGPDYDFTYLDGFIERDIGPGMPTDQPSPYYSYTSDYSPSQIRTTLDDMDDFIQGNGPFDGILGFSQGGGFVISYILDYQLRFPQESPPFSFAILISSAASFSADEQLCRDLIEEVVHNDFDAVKNFPHILTDGLSSRSGDRARTMMRYLSDTFTFGVQINAINPYNPFSSNNPPQEQLVPRILHPQLTTARITIPTVHCMGRQDWEEMRFQSNTNVELCGGEGARVKVLEHEGGHAVPWKVGDVRSLAEGVVWAVEEGMQWDVLRRIVRRDIS